MEFTRSISCREWREIGWVLLPMFVNVYWKLRRWTWSKEWRIYLFIGKNSKTALKRWALLTSVVSPSSWDLCSSEQERRKNASSRASVLFNDLHTPHYSSNRCLVRPYVHLPLSYVMRSTPAFHSFSPVFLSFRRCAWRRAGETCRAKIKIMQFLAVLFIYKISSGANFFKNFNYLMLNYYNYNYSQIL